MIVVRAVPRSSKISIIQESSNQFKIRLTSAPVEGAANAQLIKLLSEKLSLPARSVHLISGETGRLKRLKIEGLSLDKIVQLLTEK
ncbi:DUF167 domain-containing protein [bacterium]|nr:DUF167 domain-containing protein [bacterium]